MTPGELVEAVVKAGAEVHVRDARPRLVGTVSQEILDAIREQRDEFLEEWQRYERDRYTKCPPDTMPMRNVPPSWNDRTYARVERYVRHQGEPVGLWWFHRADAYMSAGMDATDATKSAIADVLYWQLGRFRKPEELLETLDQVAKGN